MRKSSNTTENLLALTSEYSEEETEFIQSMADKRGKTLEEYQKDSALNSHKKRYKDKQLNGLLTRMSGLVINTEAHLKGNGSKNLMKDLIELKGLIGETQCLL